MPRNVPLLPPKVTFAWHVAPSPAGELLRYLQSAVDQTADDGGRRPLPPIPGSQSVKEAMASYRAKRRMEEEDAQLLAQAVQLAQVDEPEPSPVQYISAGSEEESTTPGPRTPSISDGSCDSDSDSAPGACPHFRSLGRMSHLSLFTA